MRWSTSSSACSPSATRSRLIAAAPGPGSASSGSPTRSRCARPISSSAREARGAAGGGAHGRPRRWCRSSCPTTGWRATSSETLASIAAQTHPRIETIVVNDGSLRPEDEILGELAERYPISVVTQVNSGLGQARNLGIELSRGRYVLPLDPDDLILPPFVERCVEVLERRPELAYVTAWSEYMDERGRPLGAGGYRPLGNAVASLERENLAGSAMAVFRRRLFDDGLRYSPDLTSYEDWLVYRELQAAGERGHVIPETLLRYRVRRGSMLRAVAMPGRDRLLGELRAHAREAEVSWTPSSA